MPSCSRSATAATPAAAWTRTASRWSGRSALTDGVCGTFGGYVAITDVPAFDFLDMSVASARCYKYRLVVPDRVGNRSIYSTGSIVKVDANAPAVTLVNPGSTLSGIIGLTASATDSGGSGSWT